MTAERTFSYGSVSGKYSVNESLRCYGIQFNGYVPGLGPVEYYISAHQDATFVAYRYYIADDGKRVEHFVEFGPKGEVVKAKAAFDHNKSTGVAQTEFQVLNGKLSDCNWGRNGHNPRGLPSEVIASNVSDPYAAVAAAVGHPFPPLDYAMLSGVVKAVLAASGK